MIANVNKKSAINLFNKIRDITYRIPLDESEIDSSCSGKQILLFEGLTKLGYICRYRVCTFRWSDLNLPNKLLNVPHEDNSTHVFLEVKTQDNTWITVDTTWDKAISKVLHANTWDGESSTEIAVPPIEIYSVQKSHEIMSDENFDQNDVKINGDFYKEFNNWLESIRISQD